MFVIIQAIINTTFKQYKVLLDVPSYGSQLIHFAHHPSSSPTATPLLFVAGWPGSFIEAQKLIQPLTDPPSASDPAFHFVVASLPGFGPGDAPTKSLFGPLLTAHAFKILMVDTLGYQKFVTQGGDFGSLVTRNMAMLYPQHVRACHLNLMFCGPPPVYKNPLVFGRLVLNKILYSSKEQQALVDAQAFYKSKIGYAHIQSTRPQSLGFGLGDSPVGLLGWFLEKYHDWMDLTHYQPSDDEILTFVMMHWMQGATPGLRYYKALAEEKGEIAGLKSFQKYCSTPTGYSQFPGEAISPPLDWINACTNLCWTKEHDRGGHFAALEQPELLVQDVREWFGGETVRQAVA